VRAWTALLTLAFFAPIAAGCVSNEYVIPASELARLANTPPAQRGKRVRVVQEIGERRAQDLPAPDTFAYVEPPPPADEGAPDTNVDVDVDVDANVNLNVDIGGGSGGGGPQGTAVARAGQPGVQGWRGGTPGTGGGAWHGATPGTSGGAWHGATPGTSGGAWHGATPGTSGGTWHGATPGTSSGSGTGSSGSGGGHASGFSGGGGGGGGGGNIGDGAILLAVVLVVVAAVAMVGLVASEGVRFDGFADMSPAQPVHLKPYYAGPELVLPLAAITPADVAATVEAKVMDDEGFGIRRDEHVLDRRGGTFKLDFGGVAFEDATSTTSRSGPVGHIQIGYFFPRSFGLLATAALGGAGDGLGAILTRHEFGFELQALPLQFGPLHAGGYLDGGMAMAATTANGGAAESGSAAGGGLLVELDLTGRLAFTVRAGGDVAHFDDGWSPAATLSGGLAVY
jgi:hypothetical protein